MTFSWCNIPLNAVIKHSHNLKETLHIVILSIRLLNSIRLLSVFYVLQVNDEWYQWKSAISREWRAMTKKMELKRPNPSWAYSNGPQSDRCTSAGVINSNNLPHAHKLCTQSQHYKKWSSQQLPKKRCGPNSSISFLRPAAVCSRCIMCY